VLPPDSMQLTAPTPFGLCSVLSRRMFASEHSSQRKQAQAMARDLRRTRKKTLPIVGIGASAGGLEAFRQMLEKLPVDTGMGFVFVQHLDPTHASQLTELLSRATKLSVFEARNQMVVKPNAIYVIPPNKSMAIVGRVLKLTPRGQGQAYNMPVDRFLKSLAKECGRSAISVILSGTATDGAEGTKAIRSGGGITFAQDEKSAKYDGMPRAAVLTGCVDFVASPRGIANELARISRHPYVHHALPEKAVVAKDATSNDLNHIFRLVRSHAGLDFTHYKPNTIDRRIQRRMAVHRLHNLGQYTRYLKSHPEEVETLYEDLLISVTGFFRDVAAFNILKKKVLPRIINGLRRGDSLRIWVPGCATGEEVYSLAILLLEHLGDRAGSIPIQIFATDISERALAKARVGLFSENIVGDVSSVRLRRYFAKVPGGYQISKAVRELCLLAKQNVAKDPPFSNLDLISCRNVLIYLDPLLQKRVFSIFHYALKPNGFLLLGGSETITGFEQFFGPVDRKCRIYVKRATAIRPTVDFSLDDHPDEELVLPHKATRGRVPAIDMQREADRILLGRFAPASVLVNEDMEILQFRGHTGLYLEPAPGSASLNLLNMTREGLFMELRTAIHKARKQGVPIRREGLRVKSNGGSRNVSIEVVPIESANARERHYLVLFQESDQQVPSAEFATKTHPEKVEKFEKTTARLEQELTATKEHMRSMVEEFEEANEELKAANEEIQSSNEELQSTNEELETAKEELQSTNEELTTVNEELQNRNTELALTNNDLVNLLVSVNLPILMLDPDLRVRRITPAAEKVLHVLPTDIGRLVTDLRLPINVPDLESMIAESIDSLSVKTREVQDRSGHWYLLRIRPYRTTDNKIDGAVIKLLDIDPLKRSLQEAEAARDYANAIVKTIREPLIVLNRQLRVETANRAFYQLFHVTKEETEGKFIYDLGGKQWNIPALREVLEDILPRNSQLADFEVDHVFPKIGRRIMLLNARHLQRDGEDSQMILLALEDITERKKLEKAVLDVSESEQQRIGRDLHDGLGQHLTGISFMSESLEDRLTAQGLPEAAGLAAKVTKRLKEAVTQTRDLAKGLFPVELKTHGIVPALQKLALNTEKLFRIVCRFKGETSLQIRSESVSRHLYRIAQEAVFNAVKHSHGKHIVIHLAAKHDSITLTVTDDGVGINRKRVNASDMGLHIMQYRASVIDARLEIGRGPRGGTIVTCVVKDADGKRGIHEKSAQGK
jgi:two-component system, chemotaxis family, CheB/CheR fusion protein